LEDLIGAAVAAAVLRNDRLRYTLPLEFHKSPDDALAKRLKGIFRELADETFLREVVAQYKDELVRTHPLDVSNQLLEYFRPRSLDLNDVVGPRRAIVYQMHIQNDFVRINYGARTIVFPSFFAEGLEFALHHPAYAVRDIPGDLQDEERVAFIERLLQEGLVVRKQPDSVT